jgi:sialic acid synthase SpsE
MREIPEGVFISETDVALLRTEKVLRPGLPPEYLSLVIGARSRRLIPDGEGVEWADVVECSTGAGMLKLHDNVPPLAR